MQGNAAEGAEDRVQPLRHLPRQYLVLPGLGDRWVRMQTAR